MPSKSSGASKKAKTAPSKSSGASKKAKTAPSKSSAGSEKAKTAPRTFEEAARLFLKEIPNAREVALEGANAPMPDTEALRVLASADLNEWPRNGITSVLYLYRDKGRKPSPKIEKIRNDPSALVKHANLHNIIGTWNARGGARYMPLEGGGVIASVGLTHEQHSNDSCYFLLLRWRVEEGWAFGVLKSSVSAAKTAAKMLGLRSLPELTDRIEVWYGE